MRPSMGQSSEVIIEVALLQIPGALRRREANGPTIFDETGFCARWPRKKDSAEIVFNYGLLRICFRAVQRGAACAHAAGSPGWRIIQPSWAQAKVPPAPARKTPG